MAQSNHAEGVRAYNRRLSRPHPCVRCGAVLPASSLRYCTPCRQQLVKDAA